MACKASNIKSYNEINGLDKDQHDICDGSFVSNITIVILTIIL